MLVILLLLALFASSGVVGIALNITVPLFPYLFYTSRSAWFSTFVSVSFLGLVHPTFFLVRALLPFSLHVRATLLILSHTISDFKTLMGA